MRSEICGRLLVAISCVLWARVAAAQNPVCDAGGPYSDYVGVAIQFDGTRSSAVPPHVIVRYEWQFGDGATGTGPTPTHVYAAAGNYLVTLDVTDDQNLQSRCFTTATIMVPTAVEESTWGEIKAFYRD